MNFEVLKEKRKHPILESVTIFIALIAIITCVVLMVVTIIRRSGTAGLGAFVSMAVTLVFIKLNDLTSTKSVVMPRFITANGFTPEDGHVDWDQIQEEGVALTGRLHNKKIGTRDFRTGNAFSGTLVNHPFRAFELIRSEEDIINPKKLIDVRPYMLVISFDLGRELPHIYVANRRMTEAGQTAVGPFEENWLFEQPGNFRAINKDADKYVIYAPDKLEAETLTLLNTSTLEVIANAGGGCDIEFVHNRLIIYQYIGWIEDRYKSYQTAFSLAAQLFPTIEKRLQTLRFDSENQLNQSAKDIFWKNNQPPAES